MKKIKLSILPQDDFVSYNPQGNAIAISIQSETMKTKEDMKLKDAYKRYKKVMQVFCTDQKKYEKTFYLKLLEDVYNFIIPTDYEEIVVHCYASISRSPAIGIVIAEFFSCPQAKRFIQNERKAAEKHILSALNEYIKSKRYADVIKKLEKENVELEVNMLIYSNVKVPMKIFEDGIIVSLKDIKNNVKGKII